MKEKEIKTFFNKDNRLNKGYRKINNPREVDNIYYRKKFEHLLPPIEVLNEYENIYPGTLNKLMDMTEKEQQHRHAIELANAENYQKAVKIGRNGLIAAIIAICFTTICLTHTESIILVLFPLIGFSVVGLLAVLAHVRMTRKKNFDYKNSRNHTNSFRN